MKVVAIIQARMGSTRLPNKVMMKINHIPMIELLIDRLSNSKHIDQIVLATSNNKNNTPLINHVESLGYKVFSGEENDVLDRYFQAAKTLNVLPLQTESSKRHCNPVNPNQDKGIN